MRTVFLIAQREFLQRVKQKSFWIVLLLGPVFFLVALIVPIGLSMNKHQSSEILYLDESGRLGDYLYAAQGIAFVEVEGPLEEALAKSRELEYNGLLHLQKEGTNWRCRYYSNEALAGEDTKHIQLLVQQRIQAYELDQRAAVELPTVSFSDMGTETKQMRDSVGFVAGLFVAMLVLVFINQYAYMVLRGVVEEKQNRISELLLTSVKPMPFITGKITGIASVAFLQMAVWFALAGLLSLTVYQYFHLERFTDAHLAQTLSHTNDLHQSLQMNAMIRSLGDLGLGWLMVGFVFYFVMGYLLYSALFAAVGVAVGNDSDAQQLALPFTLPLALPIVALQSIVEDPHSGMSHFLSVFPLTSPTTMLIRLPFGVDKWELLASAGTLVVSFLCMAYLASKVYRVGILMYGKKPGVAELWKWIKAA